MPELLILFALWPFCALLAGVTASVRGGSGILWGLAGLCSFVFAPVVLLLAFLFNKGKPCPYCRSSIHRLAVKCPKCQSDLTARVADRPTVQGV